MNNHIVKIISIRPVTHDVKRFIIQKPQGYKFKLGQTTEIAINKKDWQKEPRPFTFTFLPDDEYLEFTIKKYPSHKGVTNELSSLKPNDELIIGDFWGTRGYKGEGVFIANTKRNN